MASSLIAGTKRKVQEFFGAGAQSSSAQNSPKKRKISSIMSSVANKALNAQAEAAAEREKAEKEAAKAAAQKASRQNRALSRSTSMTMSSRRSKLLRNASRHSMPALISTRRTTVDFKRRMPKTLGTPKALAKPGALKPVQKSTGNSSSLTRNPGVAMGKRRASLPNPKVSKIPKTPVRDSSSESESEDESPNITPASLRSASRKIALTQTNRTSASRKMTQTKLNFQPLGGSSSRYTDAFEVPDSDDEVEERPTTKRVKKGTAKTAVYRTGVKSTLKGGVRGSKRAVSMAKTGVRMGFRGKSTIRV